MQIDARAALFYLLGTLVCLFNYLFICSFKDKPAIGHVVVFQFHDHVSLAFLSSTRKECKVAFSNRLNLTSALYNQHCEYQGKKLAFRGAVKFRYFGHPQIQVSVLESRHQSSSESSDVRSPSKLALIGLRAWFRSSAIETV